MRREKNIPARSTPPSGDSPEDSASAADRVTTGYCGAISASLPLHAVQRFSGPCSIYLGDAPLLVPAGAGKTRNKYPFIVALVNIRQLLLSGKMNANAFIPSGKM